MDLGLPQIWRPGAADDAGHGQRWLVDAVVPWTAVAVDGGDPAVFGCGGMVLADDDGYQGFASLCGALVVGISRASGTRWVTMGADVDLCGGKEVVAASTRLPGRSDVTIPGGSPLRYGVARFDGVLVITHSRATDRWPAAQARMQGGT